MSASMRSFALLMCLAIGACDAQPPLAQDEAAIVGGTPTSDYLASVAIMASNQAFRGQVFCSGTLIADRAVLTAAHCTPDPSYIMIGTDPEAADARFVRVAGTYRDPLYVDGTFEGVSHDDAVLILAEDAPVDVPRIPLASVIPTVGTPVTWVAFGHTYYEAGDKGIKRMASRTVTAADGAIVDTANASCKADSGGSIYVTEADGLHLAGSDRGSLSNCEGDSAFIAARANATFINQMILDHGGGQSAADGAPPEPDAGTGGGGDDDAPAERNGGGGCAMGGQGGPGAAWLVGLALMLLWRRRRLG
jgi:MYXO-CTERM domain-containing protein